MPKPDTSEPTNPKKKTFKIPGHYLSLSADLLSFFSIFDAIMFVDELRGFLFFTYA